MDHATLAQVKVIVEDGGGRRTCGLGAIFLADFWAFPDAALAHEQRDLAMRRLVERIAEGLRQVRGWDHPVALFQELDDYFGLWADQVAAELFPGRAIPRLAQLVCASPFDAAVHDAFGRQYERNVFRAYGRDIPGNEVARYLGPEYGDRCFADYLLPAPTPRLPIFHLVGGLDPIWEEDGRENADGQRSLKSWIREDGLSCLKVKLTGKDLDWDLHRLCEVDAAAAEYVTAPRYFLTADLNEQAPDQAYVLELLLKFRERAPRGFENLLYVEQPTHRDLRKYPVRMHDVARLKPVFADESLDHPSIIDMLPELGWSGIALKTCKGQSHTLLALAIAERHGLRYSIQDLTNPGLAHLHAVLLGSWTRPVMGIEYNSRQYFPHVSVQVKARHPSAFTVREGTVDTRSVQGVGLGSGMSELFD